MRADVAGGGLFLPFVVCSSDLHVEEEPCSFDMPYCVASVADISGPLAQIINEKMGSEFWFLLEG